MISPNGILFIIQFLVFITFLWILNRYLFFPVQSLIEYRLKTKATKKKRTKEKEEEILRKEKEYEKRMKENYEKGLEYFEKIKIETLEEERKIIRKTKENTNKEIATETMRMLSDGEMATKELEKNIKEMSCLLVKGVFEKGEK